MRTIAFLLAFVVLFLAPISFAVEPYEARTAWCGGNYWVDGSTGNTCHLPTITGSTAYSESGVMRRSNIIIVTNDSTSQTIYVNATGLHEGRNKPWTSASTTDFPLQHGETLTLDPFTTQRIEMTGSSGTLAEGYVRIFIGYAD